MEGYGSWVREEGETEWRSGKKRVGNVKGNGKEGKKNESQEWVERRLNESRRKGTIRSRLWGVIRKKGEKGV